MLESKLKPEVDHCMIDGKITAGIDGCNLLLPLPLLQQPLYFAVF